MKNILNGFAAPVFIRTVLGCGWNADSNANNSLPGGDNSTGSKADNSATAGKPAAPAQNAFRIKGTIDDALQEGNLCDTTKEFTVPGTLEFKFTPKDARSGNYTYTGPFNAKGEGPYKIQDDGTMIVDGTGCIMGKCATYSHKLTAAPIDPAGCVSGE